MSTTNNLQIYAENIAHALSAKVNIYDPLNLHHTTNVSWVCSCNAKFMYKLGEVLVQGMWCKKCSPNGFGFIPTKTLYILSHYYITGKLPTKTEVYHKTHFVVNNKNLLYQSPDDSKNIISTNQEDIFFNYKLFNKGLHVTKLNIKKILQTLNIELIDNQDIYDERSILSTEIYKLIFSDKPNVEFLNRLPHSIVVKQIKLSPSEVTNTFIRELHKNEEYDENVDKEKDKQEVIDLQKRIKESIKKKNTEFIKPANILFKNSKKLLNDEYSIDKNDNDATTKPIKKIDIKDTLCIPQLEDNKQNNYYEKLLNNDELFTELPTLDKNKVTSYLIDTMRTSTMSEFTTEIQNTAKEISNNINSMCMDIQNTIETISSVNNIQGTIETPFLQPNYSTMTFMINRHVSKPNFTELNEEDEENTQTIKLQELIKNKSSIKTKKDEQLQIDQSSQETLNLSKPENLQEIEISPSMQAVIDFSVNIDKEKDDEIKDNFINQNLSKIDEEKVLKNDINENVSEIITDYSITETPNNTPLFKSTNVDLCKNLNYDNEHDSHINDLIELDDNYSTNGENIDSSGNGMFDSLMSVFQSMDRQSDDENEEQIDENKTENNGETVNKIDAKKMFSSLLEVFDDLGDDNRDSSETNSQDISDTDSEHISDEKVVKILLDNKQDKLTETINLTTQEHIDKISDFKSELKYDCSTLTVYDDSLKENEQAILTEIQLSEHETLLQKSTEQIIETETVKNDLSNQNLSITQEVHQEDKTDNIQQEIKEDKSIQKTIKTKSTYKDNFDDIINSSRESCVHGVNMQFKCTACDKTKQYKKKLIANCPYVNDYDLDKIVYKSAKEKVTITCKKHGEFSGNHKSIEEGKIRCPKC